MFVLKQSARKIWKFYIRAEVGIEYVIHAGINFRLQQQTQMERYDFLVSASQKTETICAKS